MARHPREPRYLHIKSSQVIGMRITIADLPQTGRDNSLAHYRPSAKITLLSPMTAASDRRTRC